MYLTSDGAEKELHTGCLGYVCTVDVNTQNFALRVKDQSGFADTKGRLFLYPRNTFRQYVQ